MMFNSIIVNTTVTREPNQDVSIPLDIDGDNMNDFKFGINSATQSPNTA